MTYSLKISADLKRHVLAQAASSRTRTLTGAQSSASTGGEHAAPRFHHNRSDTVTFPALISGSGTLLQAGPGTTILTADNTYSGGTSLDPLVINVGRN